MHKCWGITSISPRIENYHLQAERINLRCLLALWRRENWVKFWWEKEEIDLGNLIFQTQRSNEKFQMYTSIKKYILRVYYVQRTGMKKVRMTDKQSPHWSPSFGEENANSIIAFLSPNIFQNYIRQLIS